MAHNQFSLLGVRRFAPFFVTQLLGAFNDNVFRNATLALITVHMGLNTDDQSTYTNLAPALFILPFFFLLGDCRAARGEIRKDAHHPRCQNI